MTLTTQLTMTESLATLTLIGEVTTNTAGIFQEAIENIAENKITTLKLNMEQLTYLSSAGLRVLIFAKQKMGSRVEIVIIGASKMIIDTIKKVGFHHSIRIQF